MSATLRTAYSVSRLGPLMWRWRIVHSDAPQESGIAMTRALAKHVARQRIRLAQKRWKQAAGGAAEVQAATSVEVRRSHGLRTTAGPRLLLSSAGRPASGEAAPGRH
jgi:hypothetical protein